jgi:hypothetical protein
MKNLTRIAAFALEVLHDNAATVEAIDASRIDVHAALTFYDELAATLTARLPVLAHGQRESREQAHLRRCIEQDLAALDAGIGDGHLVHDPRLEVLRGQKGRLWWQRLLQRLDVHHAAAVERQQETWPRAFRYTGQRFRTELDGRYVEPGDVVRLSAHQAESLRDRFEPVGTERSPAATT